MQELGHETFEVIAKGLAKRAIPRVDSWSYTEKAYEHSTGSGKIILSRGPGTNYLSILYYAELGRKFTQSFDLDSTGKLVANEVSMSVNRISEDQLVIFLSRLVLSLI
jgi:hypothetical protein